MNGLPGITVLGWSGGSKQKKEGGGVSNQITMLQTGDFAWPASKFMNNSKTFRYGTVQYSTINHQMRGAAWLAEICQPRSANYRGSSRRSSQRGSSPHAPRECPSIQPHKVAGIRIVDVRHGSDTSPHNSSCATQNHPKNGSWDCLF